MKICPTCKIKKEFDEFGKYKRSKDGLYFCCKKCKNLKSKIYYEDNSIKIGKAVKTYRNNNLEKVKKAVEMKEYKGNYYKDNKDKMLRQSKENYFLNKDKINIAKKNYITNKRKIDVLFRLKESISGLVYNSIKNQGYKKNSRTEIILGCSYLDFKNYIESKFKENMCWENKGKWHLDHIIPVSWGKTEDEIIKLNHYLNFQPLWEVENLRKGNRWSG